MFMRFSNRTLFPKDSTTSLFDSDFSFLSVLCADMFYLKHSFK